MWQAWCTVLHCKGTLGSNVFHDVFHTNKGMVQMQ